MQHGNLPPNFSLSLYLSLLLSVSPEKQGFVSHVQPEQVLLQGVELDTAVLHPQVRDWGVVDDCEPSSPGGRGQNRGKERKSKTLIYKQHNGAMMQFHVFYEGCKIPDQWKLSVKMNLKSKTLSIPGHTLAIITVH